MTDRHEVIERLHLVEQVVAEAAAAVARRRVLDADVRRIGFDGAITLLCAGLARAAGAPRSMPIAIPKSET